MTSQTINIDVNGKSDKLNIIVGVRQRIYSFFFAHHYTQTEMIQEKVRRLDSVSILSLCWIWDVNTVNLIVVMMMMMVMLMIVAVVVQILNY